MSEAPLPSAALVGEAVDWAQKKAIEVNSGLYTENVHGIYHGLVEIFVARRLEIARLIEDEGGVEFVLDRSRRNGIQCKSGRFIQASEILSHRAFYEPIDPPSGTPAGTEMQRSIVVWFGGEHVVMEPWIFRKIDENPMWTQALEMVFTPGYFPQSIGITEVIETSAEGSEETPEEFSEHYILISERMGYHHPRPSPEYDPIILGNTPLIIPYDSLGLGLRFPASTLVRQNAEIRSILVDYYWERISLGTEIKTDINSVNKLLRFMELASFAYKRVLDRDFKPASEENAGEMRGISAGD